MSPEEYAFLLSEGKVTLRRDPEENYIYDASKTTTAVLPRDIIEQLEKQQEKAKANHEARMLLFDNFIAALKAAK